VATAAACVGLGLPGLISVATPQLLLRWRRWFARLAGKNYDALIGDQAQHLRHLRLLGAAKVGLCVALVAFFVLCIGPQIRGVRP